MKIIEILASHPQNNNLPSGPFIKKEEPVWQLKADSALLKGGKPCFIPDHLGPCTWRVHPVLRLSRLGKTIPARFAARYYDALTVGLSVEATALREALAAAGLPWEASQSFDGAAIMGSFLPMTATDVANANVALCVDGEVVVEGAVADLAHGADHLVESLSRQMTLRQGDFLYMGPLGAAGEARIGQHVEGYVNERKVLDFYFR